MELMDVLVYIQISMGRGSEFSAKLCNPFCNRYSNFIEGSRKRTVSRRHWIRSWLLTFGPTVDPGNDLGPRYSGSLKRLPNQLFSAALTPENRYSPNRRKWSGDWVACDVYKLE